MLLTESPDGEMMLRLVLRSTALEARVRSRLPALLEAVPALRVVTINVQPEHKAVLEGEREIVLTDTATLPMRLATGVTLRLGPRSFFQTNTVGRGGPLRPGPRLGGRRCPTSAPCGTSTAAWAVSHSTSPGPAARCWASRCPRDAIAAASATSAELGVAAEFVAADATAYALASDAVPDLVVVNPPRRGIGPDLAGWLESVRRAPRRLLVVQRRVVGARPRADAIAPTGRGAGARHVPAHHPLRGDGAAGAGERVSRGGSAAPCRLLLSLNVSR